MYGDAAEAARQADVQKCCRDIFAQIIDLALVVCEQREMVDAGSQKLKDIAMQDDMMRELSVALAEGPLDSTTVKDYVTGGMPLSNVEGTPSADSPLLKTLNVSMLLRHQESKVRSSKVASDILENINEISKLAPKPTVKKAEAVEGAGDTDEGKDDGEKEENKVEDEEKVASEKNEGQAPTVPFRFPLQLCVVGKPFSGTTTQSKRLAEKYNLEYINPTKLVMENKEAVVNDERSKDICAGASVSDEVLVGLVVDAVRALETVVVKQVEREFWDEVPTSFVFGFPNDSH